MQQHNVILPITHEFTGHFKVPDLGLYFAVLSHYLDVKDNKEYRFKDSVGREFIIYSKAGGFINPKTEQRAFEYILHWESDDKASKAHFTIKPFFGAGTKTVSGKINDIKFIGTNFSAQTSYFELSDIYQVYHDFLSEIDANRFYDSIDENISTITDFAQHVRYNEKQEGKVVEMLKAIHKESTARSGGKCLEDTDYGMWTMYKIDVPSFEVCNIETKCLASVKSYRINNFLKRTPDDPLRHPKLEVFLNQREYKRLKDGYPVLADYYKVKQDLQVLLWKLINYVEPLSYVSDSYFDGGHRTAYRGDFPTWDYKKITTPDLELSDPSAPITEHSGYRLLGSLAFDYNGSSTVRDLINNLEIPERSVWRYISHYVDAGILETRKEKFTQVYFKSNSKLEAVRKALIALSKIVDIGYVVRYGHVMRNTGQIRQYADRDKNLSPVFQHDRSTMVVSSVKKYRYLKKGLKDLNLTRKVTISN